MSIARNIQLLAQDDHPATEPALVVGGKTSVVAGVLSVVLYFFPNIPSGVIQGILVVSAFALPLIGAYFTRGKVWSPDSVKMIIEEAVRRALEQAENNRPKPPTIL